MKGTSVRKHLILKLILQFNFFWVLHEGHLAPSKEKKNDLQFDQGMLINSYLTLADNAVADNTERDICFVLPYSHVFEVVSLYCFL